MNYRIIPIFLVKSFERCIVTWTAAIVARDLNTATPGIHFIRQCSDPKADLHFDGNLLGLCTKGGEQIYILRDMRPGELAKTVAHEIRHCWQKKKTDGYRADRERDAWIYEREFWFKLGDPRDDMVIRALADACVQLRTVEEARLKVVREKLDWQEKLLKNLQQQKDSSGSQMSRLAESVAVMKADLREGEKVLADIL
jgi:hypothetical protein